MNSVSFDAQCRVCLDYCGDIPIYSENEESDLSADICMYGDIQIKKGDNYPQHICNNCLEMLQKAKLFRRTAKYSEKILKQISGYSQFDETVNSASEGEDIHSEHQCTKTLMNFDSTYDTEIIDNNSNSEGDVTSNENGMIMIIVSENEEQTLKTSEYSCRICEMDFESQDDYTQHLETKYHINIERSANKISCEICGKMVPLMYHKKHIAKNCSEVDQKDTITCCSRNLHFSTLGELQMHNAKEHKLDENTDNPKQPLKLKCTDCGKFVNKSYYKNHMKLHGTDLEKAALLRTCPYCKKSVSYSYYKDHLNRKHSDEMNDDSKHNHVKINSKRHPKFVCCKCGKVLKRKLSLELHELTHGAELKYKCMFCPYRGLHQGLLKIHIRTHTGDYNYKCTQCPATFLTKSNLNKHSKRHKEPVDFMCDGCSKGFYSKPELEKHYKAQHLGIKENVICDICGKSFGCRNTMMCHQLQKHKRKPLTDGKGRPPNYIQNELKDSDLN